MLEHTHAHIRACTHTHTHASSYSPPKQDYVSMSRGLMFYGVKELDTLALSLRVTLVRVKGTTNQTEPPRKRLHDTLPCFNCGLFFSGCLFVLVLLNGILSSTMRLEHRLNRVNGCFPACHFKPNVNFSLKTEIGGKRWNLYTDFDWNFTQISPLATLKNTWAPHSEATGAANA